MATIMVYQAKGCEPYQVGDLYNEKIISRVVSLGEVEDSNPQNCGEVKYLITTASESFEEAKEWASQLWSEMCSYGEFCIVDL